jgi:hypothetical protein
MEAILNQNFLVLAAGVFVLVIIIATIVLESMEDEDE